MPSGLEHHSTTCNEPEFRGAYVVDRSKLEAAYDGQPGDVRLPQVIEAGQVWRSRGRATGEEVVPLDRNSLRCDTPSDDIKVFFPFSRSDGEGRDEGEV